MIVVILVKNTRNHSSSNTNGCGGIGNFSKQAQPIDSMKRISKIVLLALLFVSIFTKFHENQNHRTFGVRFVNHFTHESLTDLKVNDRRLKVPGRKNVGTPDNIAA